jgi:hypothetical protein
MRSIMVAYLHDRRILLAALDKLVIGKFSILVSVHITEDLVDPLFWGVLVGGKLDHLARHFVYGLYDLEHFVVRYEAVFIEIVELEGPCGELAMRRR